MIGQGSLRRQGVVSLTPSLKTSLPHLFLTLYEPEFPQKPCSCTVGVLFKWLLRSHNNSSPVWYRLFSDTRLGCKFKVKDANTKGKQLLHVCAGESRMEKPTEQNVKDVLLPLSLH